MSPVGKANGAKPLGVPFRKGFDPRRKPGRGAKGRSGRKPDAWKQMMARLTNRESTLRALKRVLRDPDHPAWLGALRFAAAYAYGKPEQSMQVEVKTTLETLVAESRRIDRAEPAEVLSIEAPKPELVPVRARAAPSKSWR